MNLTDLGTLVKTVMNEDSASTGTRLFSTAQLNTFLEASNQEIWRDCVKANQSYWTERSAPVTIGTGVNYIPFSDIDGGGVHFVTGVRYSRDGVKWYVLEPTIQQESDFYESGSGAPRRYYIEGEKVYVAPDQILGTYQFRFQYIPTCPAISTSNSALGGKLAEFHSLVAYDAAIKMTVRDEGNPAGLLLLATPIKKQLGEYLERRQRQKGREIRFVRYDY